MMSSKPRRRLPGNEAAYRLRRTLIFHPKNLWWGEWLLASLGGVGGGFFADTQADRVKDFVAVGSAIVGVIIGAVVAGMAIQTAGLSVFLRTFSQLGIKYKFVKVLSPFLTTATLGIMATFSLSIWDALPLGSQVALRVLRAACGAIATALSCWTLASVIPALGTLVQTFDIMHEISEIQMSSDKEEQGDTQL